MNSKLVKAGLAGTAALAVVVGGSTFAAWSDFDTANAEAGAGYLKINLEGEEGLAKTEPFRLAPGQNKYQYFYVASADSDNTPDGRLSATISNLQDVEGEAICTTNSEAAAEGVALGGNCGPNGELADEAIVQILRSEPVAGRESCPDSGIYGGIEGFPATGESTLLDRANKEMDLGILQPGEGVCLRIEMRLPETAVRGFEAATNASQGDQASWDWQFDLTQVTDES